MARHSPFDLGHLTMQRDSWLEEFDPLRSNNESGRWSGTGDHFPRDSPQSLEEDSHPGDMDQLDRDSLSEDDDKQSNEDPLVCEKAIELVGRHLPVRGDYERECVMAQGYDLHYEGESLSIDKAFPARQGYDRDHEPVKGYGRLSIDRAQTMKDFEKQITELKKENFNLKLRIYFLEEQVQRHCDNSSEELHRMNIELKVEVESLKHEFQEKQNLLIRASKAMESLAGEHNFSIQQIKDDHLKQLQGLEEAGHRKIQLLEDELKHEKAELEKICVLVDQERMQRFNAEERLLAVQEQYNKSMGILEERDWIIQCLNETLRSKDALIAQLEKQINTMMPTDVSNAKTASLLPENDLKERRPQSPRLTCKDCLATKSSDGKEENVIEWQRKVKEMDNVIHELRQKLEESKAGFAIEEKNSVKRDKAIQGLTLALKKKAKENEKLLKEIDNLSAALAKARESGQHDQGQNAKQNSDPEYRKLILTIQAQQDLCSRLHDYERESGSLQKELDAIVMLRKWLEKDIQSNQELRKILEAQIMAKSRESDTMSFCLGDQTSYLSICLDHLGDNNNYAGGNVETANRPHMISVETQTVFINPLTEDHLHSLQDSISELSVFEKDAIQSAAAAAIHPKPTFTEHNQSTSSSSTQTELKCYADKGVLVDIFALGKEPSGSIKNKAKGILGDSESHHLISEIAKSNCEIQNDKQQKCFSNNLTKSRIPVLLKSSLGKRLKPEIYFTSRENEHVCLEKELQEENSRLLEQLKCAEIEIGALKLNKEKPKDTPVSWDDSDNAGIELSEQSLHGDLQSERLSGLSAQFKCVQTKVEKLQPDVGQHTTFPCGLEKSEKEKNESLEQTLRVENLQLEDEELSKEVKSVLENENHSFGEVMSENTNAKPVQDNTNIAERDFSAQSLHNELQLENLRLAEQLKCAQMDIDKLQAREENMEDKNTLSDLDSTYSLERDLAVQSLIKELQLENQRLVEQLKCAQAEIEKLREEKVLDDIDSSFRLDNLDTEDRDSEHSFLDKTITNSISLREINNGNPDFGVQVNSHKVTCQNIAGLCCHHDRFCIECANNQETLIFQSSSFKKVSTIQKECKLLTVSHSLRPFEDTSLSKYDLLVQSQARELSHQRQKIKESHNLSVVCSKNFINVIKAFEDLILTASLDSNIALGFREQLAQTVEWLKELEYKLSDAYYGEDDANSDHSADSLLYTPSRLVPGHKMWADKHGCHVLGLVEDYNALRKQILEAKTVLEETEAFIDHGVQTAVLNMTEHFGNVFFEKLNRTKQSLEEASCLLKLLWRVSLPLQTHSSYSVHQVEETNQEITRLRKRVLEQEKLLSGMVKRVYSENQVKEDVEKLILNQLAMTHEILKRAKGNLEVQAVDKH
ncbi:CDK5 regulatory subunit-associated protein 2-like [Pyxicephalus adspersus]|uniref:CDK5 regulatory subunit-associated protein 2 n=1 Tax=Pyxicephalus adspersus TaxID=30357 RepID=A0AAV3AWW8_PYXAD|nr:TPA: hypothetical protein GDO54_000087 [Pyxicephalus adspersus]